MHWVDASRRETMTEEPNDLRELGVNIWYPTNSTGPAARYMEIDPADPAFRRSFIYNQLGPERLAGLRSNASANVPLSPARRRYPVVLFSHGLGTVSSLYSSLIEDLASHGFIVVGIEHAYFSSPFRLSTGQVPGNRSRRPPNRADATQSEQDRLRAIREEEAIVQAQDLVFALDQLESLARGKGASPVAGRLDLGRVGVFGHSRGGFAAPHACSLDRRFDACLNLDGYRLTEAVMKNGISQPYMHIQEIAPWLPPPTEDELRQAGQTREQANAEAEEAAAEFKTTFEKMRGGAFVVTVSGAVHSSFGDSPLLAPHHYPKATIAPLRAVEITRAYIRAFFGRYLQMRRSPLLQRASPYSEVSIEVFSSPR